MRIVSVVGARPQFVKLAPIDKELRKRGIEHIIVHTGQHYDPLLSDVFFEDLGISEPTVHLGVGSDSHGKQTGAILGKLDDVFAQFQPDWVLVYGDTNSTLAAALSAVKLRVPVAHLEAGLRSFNRAMPEEHNRVLTDHCSDLLLPPTTVAAAHLAREGLDGSKGVPVVVTGDVMTDVLYEVQKAVQDQEPAHNKDGLASGTYSVATIHRAENTDDPHRLEQIIASLAAVGHPVMLLAHPRLVAQCERFRVSLERENLMLHDPVPYPDLVRVVMNSRGVITDSGGLQKEAFLMRIPCTTVRTETEWVETVELGWNVLVEPGEPLLEAARRPPPENTDAAPYGTGRAATTVVDTLLTHLVSN